jgi:Icc-related predicted phosphoesterase
VVLETTIRGFFVTDVHGSERCFLKFVNAAKFYKAKILILGGDITGKMIVPIVQQKDGSWRSELFGNERVATSEEQIQKIEKDICNSGFYPFRTSEAEMTMLDADKSNVNALFTRLMCESVARWVEIARQRLSGTGAVCYISPGNDDRMEIDECLRSDDVVINPEMRVVQLTPHHEMISLGYTNQTPWHTPREVTEEKLEGMISLLVEQVRDMGNAIFNFHCPPAQTIIDQAPKLDATLTPVVSGGQIEMIGAGSAAVKSAIEKYQPLLGLHGHIHESKGVVKIGRTICLNPGSEYGEGILRGLIFELGDKGGIKNYMFTSG